MRYYKAVSKAGKNKPDKITYIQRGDNGILLVRVRRVQLDRVFHPSISICTQWYFDNYIFEWVIEEITEDQFYDKFHEVTNIIKEFNLKNKSSEFMAKIASICKSKALYYEFLEIIKTLENYSLNASEMRVFPYKSNLKIQKIKANSLINMS